MNIGAAPAATIDANIQRFNNLVALAVIAEDELKMVTSIA
jgi:hypothetical protein